MDRRRKSFFSDKSFRVLWEEIEKERVLGNKEGLGQKSGVMGLVLLLAEGIWLIRSLVLLWNFLCNCFKRRNDSVQSPRATRLTD